MAVEGERSGSRSEVAAASDVSADPNGNGFVVNEEERGRA